MVFALLYANGAPGRIRTYDLCLRRAALYPAELRVRAKALIAHSGRLGKCPLKRPPVREGSGKTRGKARAFYWFCICKGRDQ